jgi:hypothetical protein
MEYLMTYGWAILIISIVLGSLFSLGVFSTSSFASTACIPSSGYYCAITSYTHGSGSITATIGQSTGTSWPVWAYYFCSGCAITGSGPSSATFNVAGSAMATGSQTTAYLIIPSPIPTAVGAVVSGSIWVCYAASGTAIAANCVVTAGTGSNSMVQIATLTAKAT